MAYRLNVGWIRQSATESAFLTMVTLHPRYSRFLVFISTCLSGLVISGFASADEPGKTTTQTPVSIADKDPVPVSAIKYPSLLWEISKPGLKKKGYLYGTMHVSRKLAFRLSDTFFNALNAAEVVALETDPGNWLNYLAEDRQGPAPWQQWMNLAGSRDYNRAWAINHPSNKGLEYLIRHEESLADAMLYRRDERQADFSEDTYLDLFIYQAGKKLNKQVIGLEDYRESRLMVARSRMPDRTENDQENRSPRISRWEASEKIEEAYRAGNLDLIDSLDQIISPGINYRKWMLTERNRVMALNIQRIMEGGSSLFAGVGAAHLPGDSGMIEMLRRMGYTVRPVSSRSTSFARKHKEKIEALEYRQSGSLYTSAYGDFEAQLSGVPFQMVFQNGTIRYFLPDPANGAYILLTSLPYYGAFTGQSSEHMLKRFDSLLFENVRGKILTKNYTNRNGFPAIEVRNRTAQGDLQRMLIVATPTRVWVIKMAGQGDYVAGKAGETFFNSLHLTEAPGLSNKTTAIYTPEAGGYQLLWPGEVKFKQSLGDNANYLQGHRDMETTDLNGDYYFVRRLLMHDVDYVEDDTFELSWLAKSLARDFKSKLTSVAFLTHYGSPALEARMSPLEDGGKSGVFRLAIHGTAIYAWGTSSTQPESFLQSFAFKPYKYKESFSTIRDSSLWYSALSNPQPDLLKTQEKLGRPPEEARDSFDNLRHLNRNFIFSSSTGEIVNVYMTRYHFFRHEKHIDSMWNKRIQDNLENNFTIYKEVRSKEKKWNTLDLHYSDTASIRVIRAKWFVRGRMSWCVAACYDTIHGETPFIKSFFEHFQPFDTFTAPSVFALRTDSLLRMMRSADSATRAVSRNWAEYLELKPHQVPEVIQQICTHDNDKSTVEYRVALISAIGKVHHPEILPSLKRIYLNAGDTAVLQVAILKALASQHTEEAARLYAELLLEETPLTQDRSDGSDIIQALKDSLAINKVAMPPLLELLRYPDYRSDVLGVLCAMLDSNHIKPAAYSMYKKSLLLELRDGLKRLKSEETQVEQSSRNRSNPDAADVYRYDGNRGFFPVDPGYPENPEVGDVLRCARLLLPLLPDPSIENRLNKMFQSKDLMFRLLAADQWLKAGKTIPDSMVQMYLNKPMLRWGMMRLMATYPDLLPMPDSLRDGKLIAESYARFDELGSRDSITYLKFDTVMNRGELGMIYHFKVKRYKAPKGDQGHIYSIWLNKKLTDEEISLRPRLLKVRIMGKDLWTQCQEQSNRLVFESRKRWKSSFPKGSEYEHYGDDD